MAECSTSSARFSRPRRVCLILPRDRFEELAPDPEWAATDRDVGLLFADIVGTLDQMEHVRRIERRRDRHDRLYGGNPFRRRDHRCAAERMPDQDRGRADALLQERRSSDQIIDIRAEMAVGERALAVAQAGEIEAERSDALLGKRKAHAAGTVAARGAGEAMREQRHRAHPARRQLQRAGQHHAARIGE